MMNVLTIAVLASTSMLITALIIYLIYLSVRSSGGSEAGSEPYLCGESVNDFRDSISVGSENLFWGSTSATLRKLYEVLRDRVHTGILNDWLTYMGIWFSIATMALFIVTIASGGYQ